MGFAALGLPRLTWNPSELLASTASQGKEIYSLIAQLQPFVVFVYTLFAVGELALHTVSRLWDLMDFHSGIRLFSALFLVPLLIITNVLFAVLLLLSIESPAFWNCYSPRAHSSVVITSSGPIILSAKLGRFLQLFALCFSLLCCSVLSPSLHSVLIFTTPNNLISAHFITFLLTVSFALQYFYHIVHDYVEQLYFHASSQGRKMPFFTENSV